MRNIIFSFVSLLLLLSACTPAPKVLPHDAYIWQRQWTPALLDSMQQATPLVRNWRILAAELDGQGKWFDLSPLWSRLQGQPVTLVIRVEGQLVDWDEGALITHIMQVARRWQAKGVAITSVEIDHDCATARLPAYAHFLQNLRPQLVATFHGFETLSITALPTWLDSQQLESVLRASDEAVLQLHAVQSPVRGLFDPVLARRWMLALATRTDKPWRVALPAYGTRVAWDDRGDIVSVASEQNILTSGAVSSELIIAPQLLSRFIHDTQQQLPAGLVGFVWFRLPTDNDARAWSPATWRAVIAGLPLQGKVEVQLRPGTPASGVTEVVLVNSGDADIYLPSHVAAATNCHLADGINGYALDAQQRGLMFYRTENGLLRVGSERRIGWVNCPEEKLNFHVEL